MRYPTLIVWLCILGFFSAPTWAVTGHEIYEGCAAASKDNFNVKKLAPGKEIYIGHCLGLITGFAEMIRLYEGTEAPPVACIPKDVTVSDLSKDVVEFLEENRAHWDMSASVLVLVAIKNNYLC